MREKRTQGEEKTAACVQCAVVFEKKRYDQRCCNAACSRVWHNAQAKWKDRTDCEQQNQRRTERYALERETLLPKLRADRQANPEKYRELDRAEYRRNKPQHHARAAAYRKAHPEKRGLEYQKRKVRRPWHSCLENAHNRAGKKGWTCDLTREWCEQNWTGHCALTGLPFVFGSQTHFPFSPSIDRIDSTKHYLQGNCRFVLFAVNSFKGTGTDVDMYAIAEALLSRR